MNTARADSGWTLLRDRNFACLWAGPMVSQVGDSLNKVALLWFVYDLTGSTLKTTVCMCWFFSFHSSPAYLVRPWPLQFRCWCHRIGSRLPMRCSRVRTTSACSLAQPSAVSVSRSSGRKMYCLLMSRHLYLPYVSCPYTFDSLSIEE